MPLTPNEFRLASKAVAIMERQQQVAERQALLNESMTTGLRSQAAKDKLGRLEQRLYPRREEEDEEVERR